MASIPFEELMTVIFVITDDWYEQHGERYLKGKVGRKPDFKDSEVMSLMLAKDVLPFPSETQFLEYIRSNYLSLFPKLLTQSQFNRRARGLRLLVEEMRRSWLISLGIHLQSRFLLDTKPVPVVGYKRDKRRSDFLGSADYGVCVSRAMKYFGYKLVSLTTFEGLPVVFELVPANLDERQAAEAVLDWVQGCQIIGDKGFLGTEWQFDIHEQTENRVWTPKRRNQLLQNTQALDQWLNSVRERVEGSFHEIRNTGRDIERLRAKTILGLCTRIIEKVAHQVMKFWLKIFYHINIQTFQANTLG